MKNAKLIFLSMLTILLFQSRSVLAWDDISDLTNGSHKVADQNTARAGTGRRVGTFDGDSEGDEDVSIQDEDGGDVAAGDHQTAQDRYLTACHDRLSPNDKAGAVTRTKKGFVVRYKGSNVSVVLVESEFGTKAEMSSDLTSETVHKLFGALCRN
jgi:hypothetical protein